ncbi:oligosaccharide flippase family protein [Vibrio sp. S234-5]|uniref:lipopolysaccharide biosynthesis protein n=1 Tax=Vibrio sp. S234-5 TaxID=1616781 RepID=UPI0005F0589D|nr:oligosaccharide flippase family protein [Vibrio sp. S234-5]KJR16047.1 hypothetical protein UF06_22405 [Vibrio sp. S234-5]
MNDFKSKIINVVFGTSILQLSTIANFIILARLLSVDDFGLLRQLLLISQMVFSVIFATVPVSVLYFCGLHKDGKSKSDIVITHTKVCVFLGLASGVLIFTFKDLIALIFGREELAHYLIEFSLYPLFIVVYYFVPTVLIALGKEKYIKWYCPFVAVSNTAIIALAALIYGLDYVVYAYVLSSGISFLLALWVICSVTKNHYDTRFSKGVVSYNQIIKYSWFLTLASCIGILASRYDHVLVSNELGVTVFAVYAVGAFQLPIYSIIQSSVNSVIFGKMVELHAKGDWLNFSKLWVRAINKISIICLPLSALFMVFSEEFISVLFGKAYVSGSWIFICFSLLAPIRCVSFGHIFKVIGKPHLDVIGAVFLLIMTLLFVTVGTKTYGALGAAIGVVLSVYSMSIFLVFVIKQQTKGNMKLLNIFPASLFVTFFSSLFVFSALKYSFFWLFY